jgi:hypothetical protein
MVPAFTVTAPCVASGRLNAMVHVACAPAPALRTNCPGEFALEREGEALAHLRDGLQQFVPRPRRLQGLEVLGREDAVEHREEFGRGARRHGRRQERDR